jgi:hypothetical protein
MSRGCKIHVRNGGIKKYCTTSVLMQTANQPGPVPKSHVVAKIAAGKRNHEGFPNGFCKATERRSAATTKTIAKKYRRAAVRYRKFDCAITNRPGKR